MALDRSLKTTYPDPYRIDKNQFKLCRILGAGAFANVYAGELEGRKEEVAIKQVYKSDPGTTTSRNKEIDILIKLTETGASNTVKLIAYAKETDFYSSYYYIAMTYAPRGTLTNSLTDATRLNLERQIEIMIGVTKALVDLHRLNIIHCDIKPDNVLLDANFKPLLCDFGLSMRLNTDIFPTEYVMGSPLYLAPEMWTNGTKNNERTDIFALGYLFCQVIARKILIYPHFTSLTELKRHICQEHKREIIPDEPECPKKLAKLITWQWLREPLWRPSAVQVLQELKEFDHDSNTIPSRITF